MNAQCLFGHREVAIAIKHRSMVLKLLSFINIRVNFHSTLGRIKCRGRPPILIELSCAMLLSLDTTNIQLGIIIKIIHLCKLS